MQHTAPCIPTEFNLAEQLHDLKVLCRKNSIKELKSRQLLGQLCITPNKNEHLPVSVKGFCRTVGGESCMLFLKTELRNHLMLEFWVSEIAKAGCSPHWPHKSLQLAAQQEPRSCRGSLLSVELQSYCGARLNCWIKHSRSPASGSLWQLCPGTKSSIDAITASAAVSWVTALQLGKVC